MNKDEILLQFIKLSVDETAKLSKEDWSKCYAYSPTHMLNSWRNLESHPLMNKRFTVAGADPEHYFITRYE